MKLKSLSMSNYCNIENMNVNVKNKILYLMGPNRSGKTSIMNVMFSIIFPGNVDYISRGKSGYSIKVWTDHRSVEGTYAIHMNNKGKIRYLHNEKPVTKDGYERIFSFDMPLAAYCLSPLRFDEHKASFKKEVIKNLLGLCGEGLSITVDEAKKELSSIDIAKADDILRLSRERKESLDRINREITANEVRIEAYKIFINKLRECSKDIMTADSLAQEIINTEDQLEIAKSECKLRQTKRDAILATGYDANAAINIKIRYEFLKSLIERDNTTEVQQTKELRDSVVDALMEFYEKQYIYNNLAISSSDITLGNQNSISSISDKFIVDAILKRIAAKKSGVKIFVVDDTSVVEPSILETLLWQILHDKEIDSAILSGLDANLKGILVSELSNEITQVELKRS